MYIEIKDNKLRKESKGYEPLVVNILQFIESYLILNGTDVPESSKVLVYINSDLRVRFVFEDTPKNLEIKFRDALAEFYKL